MRQRKPSPVALSQALPVLIGYILDFFRDSFLKINEKERAETLSIVFFKNNQPVKAAFSNY
jgi:hypothetical protein